MIDSYVANNMDPHQTAPEDSKLNLAKIAIAHLHSAADIRSNQHRVLTLSYGSSTFKYLPVVCGGEFGTLVCENSGSQIGELIP